MTFRLATIAAVLLLAACGGDGRTVLTVYSPHGKDLLAAYEAEFEKANPAIDVQWMDMGSQEVLDRLRALVGNIQEMRYVGRPERASPAEGFEAAHKAEQARIVAEALNAPQPSKRRAVSRSA